MLLFEVIAEMKKLRLAACLLFFAVACHPSFCRADALRFAPLPMASDAIIKQQFQFFSTFLSEQLDQDVEQLSYQSYQTLISDLLADKIDLAHLGPLPYLLLSRQDPTFVPLVRFVDARGADSYTCSLVSFQHKFDLQQLSDETSIALTQPYSTCGYLMTEHLLQQQGKTLQQFPYYFAGNHSEAVLEVVRGNAVLAGVKTSVAEQYRHLGVHIEEQDIALPGHLLVANARTLSPSQIELIRRELLTLDPRHNLEHRKLTSTWGQEFRYGAIPVATDDYQFIEDLLAVIAIPGVGK